MALITAPTLNIVSSSFRLVRVVGQNESPFTKQQQVYKWPGEAWEGEVTVKPMTYAQAGDLKAFLALMQGQKNTFLYGDPDFLARGLNGAGGGTPLVNGGSQTGNSLITDGWPATTLILKAGDYIQLGSGSTSELYMQTADITSDGSGNATLSLEPALRSSPGNNEAIVTTGAKGVFRLTENIAEWNSNQTSITQIVIPFKEAL